jgi:hypothetical protein
MLLTQGQPPRRSGGPRSAFLLHRVMIYPSGMLTRRFESGPVYTNDFALGGW